MKNSIEIFPTKIYKVNLSLNTDKIYQCIRQLEVEYEQSAKNTNHNIMINSLTYGNAIDTIHTMPAMSELVVKANKHGQKFWNELGYMPSAFTPINKMWFNIYKKNSFVGIHNQSPVWIVGVYYLSKTDEASNLHILNPNEMLLKTQPYPHEGYNEYGYFEEEVPVTSGDLVLFPGYLKHRTSPVSDDSERISIAFNFRR